jgi:hypothetical protein
MKLDPGMHIGLHLVFFGKTGVTISKLKMKIHFFPFSVKVWSFFSNFKNKKFISNFKNDFFSRPEVAKFI